MVVGKMTRNTSYVEVVQEEAYFYTELKFVGWIAAAEVANYSAGILLDS